MLDLVLVGGSLTNKLLAWRLIQKRPDVTFMLLDTRSTPSGNQTIWFRGTDITKAQLEWLWVLCAKSFPSHDMQRKHSEPRRIGGAFHSIDRGDLDSKVRELAGERIRVRAEVKDVHDTHVTLTSGETIEARAVIDGRDVEGTPPWPHTFQDLHLVEVESGLEVPVMALRKTTPVALPIASQAPQISRPIVGTAVGLFHHSTGDVLPMAVDLADVVPQLEMNAKAITQWLSAHVEAHWNSMAHYRAMNARLTREDLFEKVHAQSDDLIARFYAGTMTMMQQLKLRLG